MAQRRVSRRRREFWIEGVHDPKYFTVASIQEAHELALPHIWRLLLARRSDEPTASKAVNSTVQPQRGSEELETEGR